MLRRVLFCLFLLSVSGIVLANPDFLLAAPANSITFIKVAPTSCTANTSIQVNAMISVAPNDNHRIDTWTISNPAGMSITNVSASPGASVDGKGRTFAGYIWMSVPQGTRLDDSLTVNVQMVSTINQKASINTVSGTFNCSTGQFIAVASNTVRESGHLKSELSDIGISAW